MSYPDPLDWGVGVILKQGLWTGMDHEEHHYFMNLSERKSAACEPRSRCLRVQPEFTFTRRSPDLSDAGVHSGCLCKRKKRGDGDGRAQEALGSSCQEGRSQPLPTLSLQAPVFHTEWSRVPGRVGNAALWRRFTPAVPSLTLVLLERQQTSGTAVRRWPGLELLPQMAVLSLVPRQPGFATLPP